MVSRFGLLVFTFLLLGARPPIIDDTAQEKAKLTGTWVAVAVSRGPVHLSQEELQKVNIIFTARTVTFKNLKEVSFSYKLATNAKPKQIDMTLLDETNKGKTSIGIYDLDGEMLRLCVNAHGGPDRPTKFEPSNNGAFSYYRLKREKQ